MRPLRWPRLPIIFSTTYALLFVVLMLVLHRIVRASSLPDAVLTADGPWLDIFTYASFAWIIFMTYLGSFFDGSIDRISESAD